VLIKIVPASRVTHADLFASTINGGKDLDDTYNDNDLDGPKAEYDETDVENLK